MLNAIIKAALRNRVLVAAAALFLLVAGGWALRDLRIDVFPDLNRPRVVVMTEAHGMAPEEVETLITIPLETALNGAAGVQTVRTSSGVGISVVNVEFDWGADILQCRQIVSERLALASEQLPADAKSQLAPISSIMGQIVVVGMFSATSHQTLAFQLAGDPQGWSNGPPPATLISQFQQQGVSLGRGARLKQLDASRQWTLVDPQSDRHFTLIPRGQSVEVHRTTSPMQLRTLADWTVRRQLLTIPGVSQVFVMGGERRQFQVLINPELLLKYGVTIEEIEAALERSNQNATGGYLDELGPNELLVRALGRIKSLGELEQVVVAHRSGRAITLDQVARVTEGAQIKRGDSAAFERVEEELVGGDAVVLTINKQPGADTRKVTLAIAAVLDQIGDRLPPDIQVTPDLYQQKVFIDLAIENVLEALRDGGLLVVVILFLFLLNFRTTFITLTAIPLSIVVTGLVFYGFGLSINTMTLGGLAVAIGELVDDAIVDVENIFRRLAENRRNGSPKHPLLVVYQASVEVRNSIVSGTMIVVLVFIPLFALGGMEGRLFTPLGVAYIVSILSSLLVSLTLTPVLSYWLLPRSKALLRSGESLMLRALQKVAAGAIRISLFLPLPMLTAAALAVVVAGFGLITLDNDFLPTFNEGAVQINVLLPPGASLKTSNQLAAKVETRLADIPEIRKLVRRTGRAELDEHAEGVNASELIATLDPHSPRSRETILADIRSRLADIPGIVSSVEQPISHLMSHMLSGVKAQIAVKVYGDDLDVLRRQAERIKESMDQVDGVEDLYVEPQIVIPQVRIEVDGHLLREYGLNRGDVTELVETAMNGHVVSEILLGEQRFDLLLRLDEPFREDLQTLKRLSVPLPGGGTTTLQSVARIYPGGGPNTINRENVRRRIVLQCNVSGRGLVEVVEEIKRNVEPIEAELPENYRIEFGGQFEAQQSASRLIAILFALALVGVFLVLFSMFRSVNLSIQVMAALPMAFIGSVAALHLTGQTLTIAAMVGFVSLCGIASRNGILLINHYLHLVKYEGEQWTTEMIVRAGKERLAPVLMTALTSGVGLVPLALAAGEPGKEILYPVATVIIGGLISSTLLEFLVRPALFWSFGLRAAQRVTELAEDEVELVEEKVLAAMD